MKKNAELSLELARKMYKEGGVAKDFALENFSEKELNCSLPKRWEDLEHIEGYFVGDFSTSIYWDSIRTYKGSKGCFRTEEQANAAIALAQLSQLMHVYNEGWEPDWTKNDGKFVVCYVEDKIITPCYIWYKHFLTFKSREIRDKFLENFRELIEQAKPLL